MRTPGAQSVSRPFSQNLALNNILMKFKLNHFNPTLAPLKSSHRNGSAPLWSEGGERSRLSSELENKNNRVRGKQWTPTLYYTVLGLTDYIGLTDFN